MTELAYWLTGLVAVSIILGIIDTVDAYCEKRKKKKKDLDE
jgi:general stress protein CsbA